MNLRTDIAMPTYLGSVDGHLSNNDFLTEPVGYDEIVRTTFDRFVKD